MEQFCYLTTTGRRSGEPHEIEIWFAGVGDAVYLISGGGDRSDWVQNLLANPSATVRIGGQTFAVTARLPMTHDDERATAVSALHAKYAHQVSGSLDDWLADAYIVALDRS